jgi:hypothetical protein
MFAIAKGLPLAPNQSDRFSMAANNVGALFCSSALTTTAREEESPLEPLERRLSTVSSNKNDGKESWSKVTKSQAVMWRGPRPPDRCCYYCCLSKADDDDDRHFNRAMALATVATCCGVPCATNHSDRRSRAAHNKWDDDGRFTVA